MSQGNVHYEIGANHVGDRFILVLHVEKLLVNPRTCKRSENLFKSLLFWLAGKVSWLPVEVVSPY